MDESKPDEVPVSLVDWPRSVRIVPSRFPPVGVFDRVATPEELDSVFAVEAMTNDRLREAMGDIALVRAEDRVVGPGTTPIMAAFTHPRPSRFTDGSFGVYYCAASARTAVRETIHHRERFLSQGGLDAMNLEMREYLAPLRGELHDLRGLADTFPDLYSPDDYTRAQGFGTRVRETGSRGIVYDSVRDPDGGECAGVLRPPALGPCTQGRHLIYQWDGSRITHVLEVSELGG